MISCDQHDYVEIACMYRYPLKITLQSGYFIEGIALDTQWNSGKKECIKLLSNKEEILVILSDIKYIEVMIDNPHFQKLSFVE